ncbi:MAG: sigma-70 family RNA polymerase sigma factor [Eubacterium sp.]|nr:sigma-70 family RNA polymerase sigma factor [Eubacterium sp.]
MTDMEWALVGQAKQGDAHAFALLYEKYYRDLYRFALYYLKNEAQAEDAVSGAVLKAYEKLPNLRQDSSFKSWLFQITANECRMLFRQNRETAIPENYEESTEEQGYAKPELNSLLRILTDDERMVVTLAVFSGYRSTEIGNMLSMRPGTVRSLKSRALEKLRTAIAPAML